MNISLPDSMKAFVDAQVKERGYGSHSEYLRDLVRKDELEAAKNTLRALAAEGLTSPPGRSWNELKADLVSRAHAHAVHDATASNRANRTDKPSEA